MHVHVLSFTSHLVQHADHANDEKSTKLVAPYPNLHPGPPSFSACDTEKLGGPGDQVIPYIN